MAIVHIQKMCHLSVKSVIHDVGYWVVNERIFMIH